MATRSRHPLASRIGIASELRKFLPNMLQIELYGSWAPLVQSSLFEPRSFGAVTCAQDVDSKILNRDELQKKLQSGTENNYQRRLELWQYYAELNPGADPNDVLDAKTFIYDIAHSINGKYGDSLPCCSTVLQVWKDLGARWNWRFKVKLNSSTFTTVSNFIKGPLTEEMNLARRKRERCYGTMTHFVYLGTQLWEGDWGVYKRPGARIDLWGEIQLKVFTSARVGEYIESSARAGTGRGLHFKDVKFGVFRNEHGNAEFAMQVVKDAKGMTFTPSKRRAQHSIHEGLEPRPLYWNPILTHLAIFLGRGAFKNYKTVHAVLAIQPPGENEMFQLYWEPNILNEPIYQSSDGQVDTSRTYCSRLRELGFRAGYSQPPTNHDFRAEGVYLIDRIYTSSQRKGHAGHYDDGSYENYYRSRNPGTDGQAAYFGDAPRSLVNDLFRAMTLSRNPELCQSLPAEKQHELESSSEFTEIEEKLDRLSIHGQDDGAQNQRKDLQAQKRKLISEALRKFQKSQVRNFSEENEADDCDSRRALFDRFSPLVPLGSRLSKSMFAIDRLRGDMGRAALHDLVTLYKQTSEVEARPGLEPAKCSCPVPIPQSRELAAQSWRHVYGCFGKSIRKRHGFAQFCFSCSKWFLDETSWTAHCLCSFASAYVTPNSIQPVYLRSMSCYAKILPMVSSRPNFAPNPADAAVSRPCRVARPRAKAYQRARQLKTADMPRPSPEVPRSSKSLQEMLYHLQDVHCWIPRKGGKRLQLADATLPAPCRPKKESTAKRFMDPRIGQELVFALQSPRAYGIDNSERKSPIATKHSSSPTPSIDQTPAPILKHSPSPWSPQIPPAGLASPETCSSEALSVQLTLEGSNCDMPPSTVLGKLGVEELAQPQPYDDSFTGIMIETGHVNSSFYSKNLELNSFQFDDFNSGGLYFDWSSFNDIAFNSFNDFKDFSNFSNFSSNHFSNGSGLPSININASMLPPPILGYSNDFNYWKHGYGGDSCLLQPVEA